MASLGDLIAAYQPEAPPPAEAGDGVASRTTTTTKRRSSKSKRSERSGKRQRKNDDGTTATTARTVDSFSAKNSRSSRKRRRDEQKAEANSTNDQRNEEDDDQIKEVEEEVELDLDWLEADENDRADSRKKTDEFHESYAEAVRALYSTSTQPKEEAPTERPSDSFVEQERRHLDSLNVIHNALHPQGLMAKSALTGGTDSGAGYSNSLAGRYQPRRKRERIKPGAGNIGNRHDPDMHYRYETQEEVENRVRRRERVDTNRFIRMRWKRRAVTFQEEDDVGSAFSARAQLYLSDNLRQENMSLRRQEQAFKQKIEEEQKERELREAEEREKLDELEDEDSVREQSQLLAQLSQGQSTPSKVKDEKGANEDTGKHDHKVMDYWEYGHVKPRSQDLQFKYNPSMKELVQQTSAEILLEKDQNDEDDKECTATFRQLTTSETLNEGDRLYFPPNSTSITNAVTTFRPGYKLSSARQFLTMASRALCGAPSGDIALEDRYIRLLCVKARGLNVKREENATLSNFRISRFVTMYSEELGQSLFLYVQNAWADLFKAAHQLGLLDIYQQSPIADTVLTGIQSSYKTVRVKTKKTLHISSRNWSFDNAINEDADRPDEAHGNDCHEKEMQTSGGVFDEMTRTHSIDATMDESLLAKLSSDSRGALITANSFYSHVAGIDPPIPQLPLDPTNVVFGPVDKHANFYHASVKMEHGIYKLILSTLLTRVAAERCSRYSDSQTPAPNHALRLASEFADGNENNLHKRFANQFTATATDIPLVEFYRGVFEYCSFLINGCAPNYSITGNGFKREKRNEEDENLYNYVESMNKERWLVDCGMNRVAESVWDYGQTKIKHNGLLRFPKMRICFGVAMICRRLPATAASILSAPLDEDVNRSPIHLFKNTLEHMEDAKMLLDNVESLEMSTKDSIRAAELEYIIYDASDLIRQAIILEPVNVEYHLWYIGCLSSCLLLSSGNRISSRASLYPSQKKESFLFSKGFRHEVRTKLKKYDDVRLEVATAFKSMLTLAQLQSSARVHFAVSTVLEWSQVMGLLVGSHLEDYLDDIVGLHSFHINQWLIQDTSSFAMNYIERTKTAQDVLIHSRNLEIHPTDLSLWRRLVQCLGPLGTLSSPAEDVESESHREHCSKCRRLCQSRSINHARNTMERSLGLWWGEGREWWEESVLFSTPYTSSDSTSRRRRLTESILKRLRDESQMNGRVEIETSTDNRIRQLDTRHFETNWLPQKDGIWQETHEDMDISDEERSKCYAKELPMSLEEMVQEKTMNSRLEDNDPHSCLEDIAVVSSPLVKVKAYKVLVLCHLFGPDHPSVSERIYNEFILKCYEVARGGQMKSDCDELVILKWLLAMGLNLEAVFEDLCSERGVRSAKYRVNSATVEAGTRTSVARRMSVDDVSRASSSLDASQATSTPGASCNARRIRPPHRIRKQAVVGQTPNLRDR